MRKNKKKFWNKNECNHPKKRISSYFENRNNTYYEKCCRCGKTLYVRKFPKVVNK